jgi:hypothetical protein
MASTTNEARHSNPSPEAKPDPRSKHGAERDQSNAPPRSQHCHPVSPKDAPSSAAENHADANQKCDGGSATGTAPKTASKDQREKATG